MNEVLSGNPNIDNISELIVPDETRILSLSDIHGDIHSLIIALRDCGEVISKQNFRNDQEDHDLENLLNIDISEKDNGYIDTLNYNWIGGNTHIVIIGDFLDMNRDESPYENGLGLNEYPQIEIKIFRFINAINKQAQKNGGRIIKMFGNHELMNIIGSEDFIKRYSYPITIQKTNYYRNNNRIKCFMRGEEGYKLMLEDGMYLLFKINNNLFVHGGPVNDLNFYDYNRMNYIINRNNKTKFEEVIKILVKNDSPLWTRYFGDEKNIEKRIYDNDKFCNNVKQLLIKIKGENFFYDDIKTIRIIIGHCVQSSSTFNNLKNTTFNHINKEKSNNIKEVLESKLEIIIDDKNRIIPNKYIDYDYKYRGIADLKKRIVFGITMECDNDYDPADNYIYKVDVGTTRGFDSFFLPTKDDIDKLTKTELENKYLLSRTPQILEIKNNNSKIIRSLVNNTKIHQPRHFDQYVQKIKTIKELEELEENN